MSFLAEKSEVFLREARIVHGLNMMNFSLIKIQDNHPHFKTPSRRRTETKNNNKKKLIINNVYKETKVTLRLPKEQTKLNLTS
jgi:hypothetical protein